MTVDAVVTSSVPDEQTAPEQRLVLQIVVQAAAATLPAVDDEPADPAGAWSRTLKHYPVVITDDTETLHVMWTEYGPRSGERIGRAAFAPQWLVDDLTNAVDLQTLVEHARARGALPPEI